MPLDVMMTRGKDGVSCEGFGCRSAGDHQCHDERHFDYGHRDSENQRPEWFTDAVRDDLGVVNRAEHGAGEQGRDDANDRRRKRPAPGQPQVQDGHDRHHDCPGKKPPGISTGLLVRHSGHRRRSGRRQSGVPRPITHADSAGHPTKVYL